jgi:excisionase family DNA binding protein
MPLDRDVLTTGEVAKLCNVAPRTVSKWFDAGQLKGYRIPGSKDRRIPVSELVRFMKEHGIPLDGVISGSMRVLIVDEDKEVVEVLKRVLGEQTDYEVNVATGNFEAGLLCERFRPHVVLINVHMEGGNGQHIAQLIRQSDATQLTRVIAMSGKLTDGQMHGLRGVGYDGFLKKPFQVRQVINAIEQVSSVAA